MLGAFAEVAGSVVRLRAMVGRSDGTLLLRADRSGSSPEAVAREVAEELASRGARELIQS